MLHKRGLRFIGVSLLMALLATALTASSAQAADWLVEVSPGVHELVTNTNALPIALEPDQQGTLVATVNGLKAEISCKGEEVSGSLEGEGKAKGKLKYTGCTILNGGKATACEPHSPGQAVGTILSNELKAQAFESEVEDYISVEPTAGTTLATIELGEECAFGETMPIQGKAVVKGCDNLRALALRHLLELDNTKSTITALSKTATISGSTWVKLTNDKRWKLMPVGVL